MEFSFDRANGSAHSQKSAQSPNSSGAQTVPNQPPPQSAETAHADGIDISTIANERLRKAIERNRARQAARGPGPTPAQATQAPTQNTEQASFFDKQEEAETAEPIRPRAQERVSERVSRPRETATASSSAVTRRSAARPNEADFTPVKRTTRKVASQISYTTNSSSSRKKTKQLDPTLVGYLVKGCWIFCAVMVLRLIFAHGGVTDFYSRRSLYEDRLGELDKIKKENMQLVREIERMQTDTAFQKKLVRDNLGFIAADEFLVLFPKEKAIQ